MATKKTKFDIMNIVKAGAGGGIGEVSIQLGSKYIPGADTNPMIGSLIPAILGSAGLYFMKNRQMDAVFYGMIGASGGEIADELLGETLEGLDGFSRVNYKIPQNMPSQPIVSPGAVQGMDDEDISMMEEEIDTMGI